MRGSESRASGASASDRSAGPILDAQPAQRANCVRRKISERVCDTEAGGSRSYVGNSVDFHEHAARETGDLHGGTSGTGGADHPAVDLIDLGEVGHVLKIDGRLDDVGPGRASALEDSGEVTEHALRLRGNVTRNDLPRRRIESDLARGEHQVAGNHGL